MSDSSQTKRLITPAPAAGRLTGTGARLAPGDDRPPAAAVSERARRPPRSRARTIWRWLVPMLVLAMLAPPVMGLALVGAIYWQAREDEARPVDAIVVLGAAQYNGRPTSVLRARLDHVVTLYDRGLAPLVVVTGGKQEGDATTEAEASRDYLVEHGLPPESILMENEGRDTWQSLQGVAALLTARQLTRVVLVSDGFHLLRSKLMARDLGLKPFASAAPESPIQANTMRELGFALREAVAITVYEARRVF